MFSNVIFIKPSSVFSTSYLLLLLFPIYNSHDSILIQSSTWSQRLLVTFPSPVATLFVYLHLFIYVFICCTRKCMSEVQIEKDACSPIPLPTGTMANYWTVNSIFRDGLYSVSVNVNSSVHTRVRAHGGYILLFTF